MLSSTELHKYSVLFVYLYVRCVWLPVLHQKLTNLCGYQCCGTDKLGNDVLMMSASEVKRSANSSLSDDEQRRQRVLGDSIVDDPDDTITNSSFLCSTLLDDPSHTMPIADSTITIHFIMGN